MLSLELPCPVYLTSAITKRLGCPGKSTAAPNISSILFNFQLVRLQVIPVQILFEELLRNMKLEINSHVSLVREGGFHTSHLSDWI